MITRIQTSTTHVKCWTGIRMLVVSALWSSSRRFKGAHWPNNVVKTSFLLSEILCLKTITQRTIEKVSDTLLWFLHAHPQAHSPAFTCMHHTSILSYIHIHVLHKNTQHTKTIIKTEMQYCILKSHIVQYDSHWPMQTFNFNLRASNSKMAL